jgi:hypothetical protein
MIGPFQLLRVLAKQSRDKCLEIDLRQAGAKAKDDKAFEALCYLRSALEAWFAERGEGR